MKLLNVNQIESLLIKNIKSRNPFSMIRLGDGEWTIIKWPKYVTTKLCKARIGRWFNTDHLTMKHLKSIRNMIQRACCNSDLLGVPSTRELLYPKWINFNKLRLKDYNINCSNLFHFYKVKDINFKTVLQDIDELVCITCRDILEELQKYFGIEKITLIKIPAEVWRFNKKVIIKESKVKHYPNYFIKIMQFIKEQSKGKIFLVGAGGLGKAYCNEIKINGGIALDVGSLFDGWAGLYTRPFLKNVKKYKL